MAVPADTKQGEESGTGVMPCKVPLSPWFLPKKASLPSEHVSICLQIPFVGTSLSSNSLAEYH